MRTTAQMAHSHQASETANAEQSGLKALLGTGETMVGVA